MQPLYESWNPQTLRHTTITIDSETGLPLIELVQDTRPIVESAKRLAANFDRHRPNPHGWTHIARVPVVVVRQLQRLGIWQDPKARNEWLNGRDQRVFRTDDGRRL